MAGVNEAVPVSGESVMELTVPHLAGLFFTLIIIMGIGIYSGKKSKKCFGFFIGR